MNQTTITSAELWTRTTCPYCKRAKALLDELGVPYTEHVTQFGDAEHQKMIDKTGQRTVPYIFLDGKFIGGCDDLFALYANGDLQK